MQKIESGSRMNPQDEIGTQALPLAAIDLVLSAVAGEPASRVTPMTGIARLREITGASARALRHYESAGLLSPLRTTNGARLFTPAQAQRAALIVLLRRLDVPIRKIGDILDPKHSPDSRARALKLALEAESASLTRRLEDLRIAFAALEGAAQGREPSLSSAPGTRRGLWTAQTHARDMA